MSEASTGDEARERWLVSGRVQGVGFRWFVLQAARRLGIRGEVRNLADGRVELRVQALGGQLAELLAAVSEGPPAARVDDVHRQPEEAGSPWERFEILD